MKSLIRITAVNAFSLFILSVLLEGVIIRGGFTTLIIGGLALTLMGILLKPILNIISLPLHFLTFGLSSILANVVILYLLATIVPGIYIQEFTFRGFNYAGFVFPKIYFNSIFAFVVSASLLSAIISAINWLKE